MQLIKISFFKFFLVGSLLKLLSLTSVNCYLESQVRFTDWRPKEQITFYPVKYSSEDVERRRLRKPLEETDDLPSKSNENSIGLNKDQINSNDMFKLNKKLHNIVHDGLYNDRSDDENLNDNMLKTLRVNPLVANKNLTIEEQNLIWFLVTKIIPTTHKLNQFLCHSNHSTGQLCTAFNHLHLLVGKTKRNQQNDDIFKKVKLIENLSNEFSDKSSKRNLNRKSDRRFYQKSNVDNFNNHLKFKNQFSKSDPYLEQILNSNSIYKHHQRLRRAIDTLSSQISDQTFNHKLAKRSLDNNDLGYSNVQQYGM